MEKQPEVILQPEKRPSSSRRLVFSLFVIFAAVGIAGLSFGIYSVVRQSDHMEAKHLRYREVDEDGNADVADTYVSPRQRRITQELEVEHRPGLHANSSTLLSDFNSGFRAFRTKGNWSKCVVTKIDQSFEEEVEEIETQSPRRKRISVMVKEAIHPRVLRMTAGDAIADHCQDVEAFWAIPSIEGETVESEEGEEVLDGSTMAPGARQKRAICRRRYCRIYFFRWGWYIRWCTYRYYFCFGR